MTPQLHPQHLPDVHLRALLNHRHTHASRRFQVYRELSYRFGTSHKSLRRFDASRVHYDDTDDDPSVLIARYDAYRAFYWSLMQRVYTHRLQYTTRPIPTPNFISTMTIEGHPDLRYKPHRLTSDHRIIFGRPPSGYIYGAANYQLPLFSSWQ